MKKCYKVFILDGTELKLYDHPVFSGAAAFDLQASQQLQKGSDGMREFVSPGQVIEAVNDYKRETPKKDTVPFEEFFILECIHVN